MSKVYTGIVIDDKDPTGQCRVQVYIPSLNRSLKKVLSDGSSSFVFPGDDNNSSLTLDELKELRKQCSWFSVSQPIFGGGSFGRLDENSGRTTTSDTAQSLDEFQYDNSTQSAKNVGELFNQFSATSDGFSDPSATFTRNGNLTGRDYFSKNYINAPKGMFSVPQIGTKVLIQFFDDSTSRGVIIGKVPFARESQLIQHLI